MAPADDQIAQQLQNDHRLRIRSIYRQITGNGSRRFLGSINSNVPSANFIPSLPSNTAIFYTDGSCNHQEYLISAAVAYEDKWFPHSWRTEAIELGRHVGDNNDAEVHGIVMALRSAVRMIFDEDKPVQNVVILSDSQVAVSMLGQQHPQHMILGPIPRDGRWALKEIYDNVEALHVMNVNVHIQWIRGHEGNTGNDRADISATYANQRQLVNLGYYDPFAVQQSIPAWVLAHGQEFEDEYLYRLSMPWIRTRIGPCYL